MTADIAMTERQLAGSTRKIAPKVIERFTLLMKERLSDSDPSMRRFYVNALVGRVEVGSQEIRISGNVRALEKAVAANLGAPRFQSSQHRTEMVRPTGFEPVAPRLGIWCSIRLSYGRSGTAL